MSASDTATAVPETPIPTMDKPEKLTHFLIGLQTFEGSWEVSSSLLSALKISEASVTAEAGKLKADVKVFVTALVIAVLEGKLKEFEGSWELVVEKARDWLEESFAGDVDGLVEKAGGLVK